MTVPEPTVLGPFALLRQLGEGGMGRVYLGRAADGRLAAIKVIRSEIAGDPEFRARFRQEVDSSSRVRSPYTAAVLAADTEAEVPWLATEYVPAPSLRDAVAAQGPLPEHTLRLLGTGLAEALTAIHGAGVVHRDLKPGNVLLGPDGPRVIDFGIARAADAVALTHTGSVVGTPGYLAPEQLAHSRAGPASDVFALGGVLLFAATGRPPFGEGDLAALLYRVMYADADLTGVPPAVAPLIAACLDRDPARRPDPARIRAELSTAGPVQGWPPEQYAAPARPPRRFPVGALVGALVVVLLVGAGVTTLVLRDARPAVSTVDPPTGTAPVSTPTRPEDTSEPTQPPASPTGPPPSPPPEEAVGFTTPTTNIACLVTAVGARCDIREQEWGSTVPPRPGDCSAGWGNSLWVTVQTGSDFLCASDTVFTGSPTLDYEQSVRVGEVTCTSRETGVECYLNSSGRGFTIARAQYTLY